MSGTITGRVYTEVVNENFRDKVDAQISSTQTGQGFIAGTMNVTYTPASCDFTGISTNGLFVLQHLETADTTGNSDVLVGKDVGGFQSFLRVEPQDTQLVRLASGVTVQMRTVGTGQSETVVWRLYEK